MPGTRRKPTPEPPPSPTLQSPDQGSLAEQLVGAWMTNHRVNLLLIDHIGDKAMPATLSKRGGRTVARQLAHVHMVRVRWLENTHGRDLLTAVPRFDPKAEPTRAQLKQALTASAEAVAVYVRDVATGRRDSRLPRRGIIVWFSYLIAHEAHHRGSILLTLKQAGHALDETLRWGIWDWDRI